MQRHRVGLSDISCHGCRIINSSVPLRVGQHIILKPEGLESISCTVRWASFGTAGIEFDHALHPAVVEHLSRLHPDQRTDETTSLKQEGRR